MICEVVEGTGGHIGVASCGTHTCSAAIEHSHFQKKMFTICELERPLHIDVCNDFFDFFGYFMGQRQAQISWPYRVRKLEASRLCSIATQDPDRTDNVSKLQTDPDKQTHCLGTYG